MGRPIISEIRTHTQNENVTCWSNYWYHFIHRTCCCCCSVCEFFLSVIPFYPSALYPIIDYIFVKLHLDVWLTYFCSFSLALIFFTQNFSLRQTKTNLSYDFRNKIWTTEKAECAESEQGIAKQKQSCWIATAIVYASKYICACVQHAFLCSLCIFSYLFVFVLFRPFCFCQTGDSFKWILIESSHCVWSMLQCVNCVGWNKMRRHRTSIRRKSKIHT